MKKIISYPLSVIHYFLYLFFLSVFHPIQWVCIHIFKGNSHRKSVEILNFFLVNSLRVTGNMVKFRFKTEIPKNVPLIFVCNHQSVYDIPPLIHFLKNYSPKFVGKKELDNGVPSIAINLKNDGSVLIDRNNPKEAILKLANFGKFLNENNYAGLIFPEGTRSRTGELKPFKSMGLKTIMKYIPEGYIIPVTINNSWKMVRNGAFPLELGCKVNFIAHAPVKIDYADADNQIEQIRSIIGEDLEQN